VFYNDDGEPTVYTENAIDFYGETTVELISAIRIALDDAVNKPPLKQIDLDKSSSDLKSG